MQIFRSKRNTSIRPELNVRVVTHNGVPRHGIVEVEKVSIGVNAEKLRRVVLVAFLIECPNHLRQHVNHVIQGFILEQIEVVQDNILECGINALKFASVADRVAEVGSEWAGVVTSSGQAKRISDTCGLAVGHHGVGGLAVLCPFEHGYNLSGIGGYVNLIVTELKVKGRPGAKNIPPKTEGIFVSSNQAQCRKVNITKVIAVEFEVGTNLFGKHASNPVIVTNVNGTVQGVQQVNDPDRNGSASLEGVYQLVSHTCMLVGFVALVQPYRNKLRVKVCPGAPRRAKLHLSLMSITSWDRRWVVSTTNMGSDHPRTDPSEYRILHRSSMTCN